MEKPKAICAKIDTYNDYPQLQKMKVYPAAQMDAHLGALLRFFRHYDVLTCGRGAVCLFLKTPPIAPPNAPAIAPMIAPQFSEKQPISWAMAYREISHSTELGAAILKELVEKGEI